MIGLKTLKDLDPEPCCYGINKRELQNEAIKWLKDFRENEFSHLIVNKYQDRYLSLRELEIVHQWIKFFFNITDEEIKCGAESVD
jgi:hypothetical protein